MQLTTSIHGMLAKGGRLAAIVGALLLCGTPALADPAGEQLAQQIYERPKGKDATSLVTMTLTERGHSPRVRKMVAYRQERRSGEVAQLIRFTEPADIEGTGLLTLDRASGESDQWIYLPAMDRVRRISSSRQGGKFVNSDFYYEDLRDRKVSQDEHRIVGRETIQGVVCDVLESVPVDSGNSVYVKRLAWVDRSTLLPMRVDFFEKRDDQPSKRWQFTKRERVQGYWTVLDSTLMDLASGHQTRLTVDRMLYDRRLPARLFTTQALEDESVDEEYRP